MIKDQLLKEYDELDDNEKDLYSIPEFHDYIDALIIMGTIYEDVGGYLYFTEGNE